MSAQSTPRRLMMTSFGFNDSGGGTTVPRLAAKELARCVHEAGIRDAELRDQASRPTAGIIVTPATSLP